MSYASHTPIYRSKLIKRPGSALILALILSIFSQLIQAVPVYGFVYTRNIVTNEAGNRIWGEYNPQTGAYLSDIGEATGERDPVQWRVMSGDEYRGYVKQKSDLHNAQNDLLLRTRLEYETENFLLADGVTPMDKPALASTTATVFVLPEIRRLINDSYSLVVAEYPINPEKTIPDSIFSLLHKFSGVNIGEIKDETVNRIGFKVAIAKDKDGNPQAIEEGVTITGGGGYDAVGPIVGAKIEGWNQTTSSIENGAFALNPYSIPCPGFYYTIDGLISLELRYKRFNPKAENKPGIYMDLYPTSQICRSIDIFVPFLGPKYLDSNITTFPDHAIQFAIDLTVLSGTAQLSLDVSTGNNRVTLSDNKVPVGAATQYQAAVSDDPNYNDKTITNGYDFDRDGSVDTTLAGHFELNDLGDKVFITAPPEEVQGVWLSSSGNTTEDSQPDITRVMDSKSFADDNHQGLLAEISAEDLRNTDIYVVRVSDGKLISERIGLNEYEAERFLSRFGEDAGSSQFFYTIEMQGSTGDKRFSFEFFEDWQSHSGINPDLHKRQSDHLQPGDAIRIYAINRATGYIGHSDAEMQAGQSDSSGKVTGDLSFDIAPIKMGPPNLKIRAERGYKITSGVTKSNDTITQLIGFEGASLTSDNTVTITTEWLDHQGRPLPESLAGAGYTGRIAILRDNKTLAEGNEGVYPFSIDPGKRLQVLQLPNAISGSEHFYIHLSGEPQSGTPIFAGSTDNQRLGKTDFSTSGQNPGILAKRPDHFVPFLVPIFDEVKTELQTQAYRLLKETNPGLFTEAPKPIYKWVFRPEMQFTSYDLTISEINKTRDTNANGIIDPGEAINIIDNETPLITSDSVIDLLYSLSTTDFDALDYFNAGDTKELVFVIGEQEVIATLGANQQLIFGDLSHLDLLSPDDFLTIRLYANNDMGNVLWEWAFMNLDVDVDSDNNNGLGLPDRTIEEEQIENIDGQPGKMLAINEGDTDGDGIPDYADFDTGKGFVPMVVQIPDDVDTSTAKLKITYEQSDPNIINVDDTVDPPVYEPDTGYLRIWTKNGTELRNIDDVSAGGNYIRSEEIINLSLFSIDDERVIVLYSELVRENDIWGGLKTRIEIIE